MQQVSQRLLGPLVDRLVSKLTLKLQAHNKVIQVRVKPDVVPRKDLDETIRYYDARLRDLTKNVRKLCKVIDLAYKNRD